MSKQETYVTVGHEVLVAILSNPNINPKNKEENIKLTEFYADEVMAMFYHPELNENEMRLKAKKYAHRSGVPKSNPPRPVVSAQKG